MTHHTKIKAVECTKKLSKEAAATEFGVNTKRICVRCSQKEKLQLHDNFSTSRWVWRNQIQAGPNLRPLPISSWGNNLAKGNRGLGLYIAEIQHTHRHLAVRKGIQYSGKFSNRFYFHIIWTTNNQRKIKPIWKFPVWLKGLTRLPHTLWQVNSSPTEASQTCRYTW